MTAPRGWFSNRGSAILGALALIAVLGILAVVLDGNLPGTNRVALSAQAPAPSAADPSKTPGADKSECTAPSPTGKKAADGAIQKVGKLCKPSATGKAEVAGDDKAKANCEARDGIQPGECMIRICSPTDPKDCYWTRFVRNPTLGEIKQNIANFNDYKSKYGLSDEQTKSACGEACGAPPGSSEITKAFSGSCPGDPDCPGNIRSAGSCPGNPGCPGNDPYASPDKLGDAATGMSLDDLSKWCRENNNASSACQGVDKLGDAAAGMSTDDLKKWCTANNNESPACDGNTTLQPPPGYQGPCLNGLVMDPVTGKCRGAYQGPCLNGQEMNPATGQCSAPSQVRPPGCVGAACNPGPGRQAAETGRPDNRNSTFGGLGGLGSLLSGFAKGFSQPQPQQPQRAPAKQCSTDPNMYQQQQQQYQQELQQYNYQQQMYNYQMQQYYYQQQQQQQYGGYAYGAPPPMAPVQPSPCTPANSGQCLNQQQQQQPDPSLCTAGTWQAVRSGNGTCITGWQCSNSGNLQASLSCEPKTADVGMTLAISYSCSRGTAEGRGFDVSAQPAGSASAVVTSPPAGTNTATYTLTCSDSGKTASAQCSVQVAKPTIILVANPKSVKTGDASLLGWITSGMKSCVVSSPDQPDFTSRNSANTSVSGTATTSPITKETKFLLRCQTVGGGTKEATATVTTGGAGSSGQVTIASTADGKTVNHGDKVTITWNATGQPSGSAVAIWIVDTRTYATTALIAGGKGTSGSYEWTIPPADSSCPTDAANVCGRDLVVGRQYLIEADVYTPQNAYVGDGARPSGAVDPEYGDYGDTTPAFTVGQ